jgi:hypothetical protein
MVWPPKHSGCGGMQLLTSSPEHLSPAHSQKPQKPDGPQRAAPGPLAQLHSTLVSGAHCGPASCPPASCPLGAPASLARSVTEPPHMTTKKASASAATGCRRTEVMAVQSNPRAIPATPMERSEVMAPTHYGIGSVRPGEPRREPFAQNAVRCELELGTRCADTRSSCSDSVGSPRADLARNRHRNVLISRLVSRRRCRPLSSRPHPSRAPLRHRSRSRSPRPQRKTPACVLRRAPLQRSREMAFRQRSRPTLR